MYSLDDLIKAYQAYAQGMGDQQKAPGAQQQADAAGSLLAGQKPNAAGQTGGSNAFTPQGFWSQPNAQGGTTLGSLFGGAGSGGGAASGAADGAGAAAGGEAAGALGV
jgi:hypothetical protein